MQKYLQGKDLDSLALGSFDGWIGMFAQRVTDFEIDLCDAKIISLILPSEIGLFGCPKGDELVIPWDKIECIGEDTILVKVNKGDLCRCLPEKRKHKRKLL